MRPTVEVLIEARDRLTGALRALLPRLSKTADAGRQTGDALADIGTRGANGVDAAATATQGLGAGLDNAGRKAGGLGSRLAGFGKAFIGQAAHIQAAMQMVSGAVSKVAGLFRSAISEAFDAEKIQSDFAVLLKSTDAARQHISDLQRFAASTPLGFDDLSRASKLLLSFGASVDEVQPALRMLGDISMGDAAKFQGLALVFAQVKSAGRLMGQDLLQMINQGFNPLTIIAEKTGLSVAELKKVMEDGGITFEHVKAAMEAATNQGGLFSGAMESASKTGTGMVSTLKDNWTAALRTFGEAFVGLAKDKIGALSDALKRMASDGTISAWAKTASDAFGGVMRAVQNIIDGVASMRQAFAGFFESGIGKTLETGWRGLVGGVKASVRGMTGTVANLALGNGWQGVKDAWSDAAGVFRGEVSKGGWFAAPKAAAQPSQAVATIVRSHDRTQAQATAAAAASKQAPSVLDNLADSAARKAREAAAKKAAKEAEELARQKLELEKGRLRREIKEQGDSATIARDQQRDAAARAKQAMAWFRDPQSFRAALREERDAAKAEDKFQRDFARLKKAVPNWETAAKLTRNQEVVRRLALARRDEKAAAKRLDEIAKNTKDLAAELGRLLRMK